MSRQAVGSSQHHARTLRVIQMPDCSIRYTCCTLCGDDVIVRHRSRCGACGNQPRCGVSAAPAEAIVIRFKPSTYLDLTNSCASPIMGKSCSKEDPMPGKQTRPKPQVTAQDKAVLDLKAARDEVRKYKKGVSSPAVNLEPALMS